MPDWIFVMWAGGTALLSYSLVYALRKPFTAAGFDGLEVAGMDYKIVVSIIQLIGYVCAKLAGIKFISELRRQDRLKFIIGSAALSEASLLAFGLLPVPINIAALFFNSLSLGCMWGVIFSFLEGRRTTDILASIMGVSMALSSGVAKSLGLYALNDLGVSEFWMPALIGAFAFPLLCLLGWTMTRFPRPTAADMAARSERVALDGRQRRELVARFMPLLVMLFGANLLLTVQRDIKEDFIVCIIDVSTVSSWAFAYIDSIATIVLLTVFAGSFALPQLDPYMGFRAMSEKAQSVAHEEGIDTFYYHPFRSAENIDAYIGCPLQPLEAEEIAARAEQERFVLFLREKNRRKNPELQAAVAGHTEYRFGDYAIVIFD